MAELNLIPYELKRGRGPGLSGKNLTITIIITALVLAVMIAYPLYSLFSLQAKEKELKAEIQRGEAVLKESDKLKKDIDSYSQYIKMVTGLTTLKTDSNKTIRGLEKYIVGDVVLNNLTYGNGIMTIGAKAKDRASIEIFVANIEEQKEYKGARISSMTYNQTEGTWTGTISIQY